MQVLYGSSRYDLGRQVSAPTPRQPHGSSARPATLFGYVKAISAGDAVRRQHE